MSVRPRAVSGAPPSTRPAVAAQDRSPILDRLSFWPALARLTELARSGNPRNLAIDVGRFLSIIAVVGIHTIDRSHYAGGEIAPGAAGMSVDAGQIIDQLMRFAVPFFFTASGFFMVRKTMGRIPDSLRNILVRIALPYFFWTALFTLPNRTFWSDGLAGWPGLLVRFVLQGGAAPHLWFLPSLAICMALLQLGLRVLSIRALSMIGLLLYGMGLVTGPYAFLALGHPASVVQAHLVRDAPTFGFVYMVFGFWMGQARFRPGLALAAAVFLLGAVTQLTEVLIMAAHGVSSGQDDFLAGTLPFGLGAFMLALACPGKDRLPAWLAAIGSCSLGLYAVHPVFIAPLARLTATETLGARVAIWGLTLTASVLLVVELTRWPLLRRLVR